MIYRKSIVIKTVKNVSSPDLISRLDFEHFHAKDETEHSCHFKRERNPDKYDRFGFIRLIQVEGTFEIKKGAVKYHLNFSRQLFLIFCSCLPAFIVTILADPSRFWLALILFTIVGVVWYGISVQIVIAKLNRITT